MIFAAGVVSVLLVAMIAYLALSKKTSKPVRITALAALVLAGFSLAACSLVLFFLRGSLAAVPGGIAGEIPITPLEEAELDIVPIIIFSLLICAAIVVIFIAALREKKRSIRG